MSPAKASAQSVSSVACGDVTSVLDKLGARAQGVTSVPVNDRANIFINSQTAAYHHTMVQKECVNDGLLTILAKQLIKHITASTVQWINSGFRGSPTFVQDPARFFGGIASGIAGDFIRALGLGFLCDPFSAQLQFGLSFNLTSSVLSPRYDCTLGDIAGNIDGFLGGDFSQGGWDGWFKMTQNPQNNPYDAYLLADQEMRERVEQKLSTERMKLDWGDGFLSIEGDLGEIVTPGQTIVRQLDTTLGSNLRQLELADEINEIAGALVGQLLSQVMSKAGLAGGSGGGTVSAGSDGFDVSSYREAAEREAASRDGFDESRRSIGEVPDRSPGRREGGSSSDVSGSRIAQGKPASQSTTRSDNTADYAVDGVTRGNTDSQRFAQAASTANGNDYPWWQVDLEAEYLLSEVRIWPFAGFHDGIDGGGGRLLIYVTDEPLSMPGESLFLSESIRPAAEIVVDDSSSIPSAVALPPGTSGRYVRILEDTTNVTRWHKYISFAEIRVSGTRLNAEELVLGGFAGENGLVSRYDISTSDQGTPSNAFNGIKSEADEADGEELVDTRDEPTAWWEAELSNEVLINSVTIFGSDRGGEGLRLSSNDLLAVQVLDSAGNIVWETPRYMDVRDTSNSFVEIAVPAKIGAGVRVLNWTGCDTPLLVNEASNGASGLSCYQNDLTFTEVEVRGAEL